MISPSDIIKRMGVGGRLVPFFKCVCLYFAVGGGEGPSLGTAAAKCAPVLCLLLAVALHQRTLRPDQRRYARCVCCGLALSALGDALLVWPTQLPTGMAAFAGAHLAYLAALGWRNGGGGGWRGALLTLAAAALYVHTCCAGARGLLGALVPVYAALLALMAWRAAARGGPAAVGGALFLVSDAILGYALFTGPVPHRRVLVMSTYYLGQLGIAVSALRTEHCEPRPSPEETALETPKA